MTLALSLILISMALLSLGKTAAWQHNGNFTTQNLNFIHQTVRTAIDEYKEGKIGGEQLPKNISDIFNLAWSPAWNVFVFKAPTKGSITSVVFGYAFRNHWIWFNELGPLRMSVVIWKDYNCLTWISLKTAESLSPARTKLFQSYVNETLEKVSTLYDDPWKLAYRIINEAVEVGASDGYTAVVTQGKAAESFGRFCVVGDSQPQYIFRHKNQGQKYLSYIIIRTR